MKLAALKLLIVDDSTIVIERLLEMISESTSKTEVFSASSFSEATEIIQNNRPEIVMLDIHLPDRNGIELLGFIKEKYPTIKAIMLTNQVSENYKSICDKLGADHFIDKSSEFEQIPAIIDGYAG